MSHRIFNTFEKASSSGVPYTKVVGTMDIISASGGKILVDGSQLSGTELGVLDGVTAGTCTASKALVVGTAKECASIGRFTHGAFHSTTHGSGLALSSTYSATCRVYSDDANTAFGSYTGDLRGFLSRVLITKDHSSGNNRCFGLMGHIKSYDGEWGDEQWGGVHGYLELVQNSGTINFQQYGISAGVQATVETAGTMTVDTGHVLAGVAAISKLGYSGTLTQTGKVAAFYAGIYDTTNWSDSAGTPDKWGKGLFIKGTAVTEGINVGEFSSATYGSGVVLSNSLTAANRFYADDGNAAISAAGSVPDVRNVLARTLITKDNSGNHIRLHSLMGHVKSYDGEWKSEQVSGVHGYMELVRNSATINFQGYGVTSGLMATVESSGTMTVDANHTVAGVAAISKLTSGMTQTGKTAGLYVGIYDVTNWSDATARSAWKWGAYVAAGAATNGYYANCSVMSTTGRLLQLYGTVTNAAFTDGYGAAEVDLTLAGTNTDHVAAFSSWVNITTGTAAAGTYICAQNVGIYEVTAATVTNAKLIFGMRAQKVVEDTDGLCFPFSINTNNTAITAFVDVNNHTDLGWTTGAGSSGGGKIPFMRDAAGNILYVNTYTG